jgi:hypothetical protein
MHAGRLSVGVVVQSALGEIRMERTTHPFAIPIQPRL